MDEQRYCKRSGQIPAFGNWEHANDLPITQYFECARQAGLIRYSNSSGECHHLYATPACTDLHAVNFHRPPPPKTRDSTGNKRCPHVKEQKKQVKKIIKICDGTVPPRKQLLSQQQHFPKSTNNNSKAAAVHHTRRQRPTTTTTTASTTVGAVDEDLYKIPPELLHTSKRKNKRLGFFSRCLVPPCMV